MKQKIARYVKYTLWVCVVIFLLKVFLPVSYHVPLLHKRAGTQYWNLTTGSIIGYTLIKAKGNKKNVPVIYLHGGPGGHITEKDISVLSSIAGDGFNVYLYDQVGSGQSNRLDNIKDYTVDRHIKDLEQIIQKIASGKVILIGQSWGAILAVSFTAQNPGKVEKIILTCPGPVFPVRRDLAKIKAPDSFHLRDPYYSNMQGNKIANNLRSKAITWCATQLGKKLASDKEADEFSTYLSSQVNRSTVCDTSKILETEAGSGFYAAVMTFNDLNHIKDLRPEIRKLTLPALIMKGQCDNQKWGFTKEYTELFSNHRLVIIPGAGHFLYAEQPLLYLKTIREFLAE